MKRYLLIAGWIFVVQVPSAILQTPSGAHRLNPALANEPRLAYTPVQVPSNGFFPTEDACNTAQANWVSATGEPALGCYEVNQSEE